MIVASSLPAFDDFIKPINEAQDDPERTILLRVVYIGQAQPARYMLFFHPATVSMSKLRPFCIDMQALSFCRLYDFLRTRLIRIPAYKPVPFAVWRPQ